MGTKAVPTHRSKQEATETQVWKVKHQPHAPFHSEVWSDGISPCRWSSTDWLRCLRDIETISISHIRDRHREKWSLLCSSGCPIAHHLPFSTRLCSADLGTLQGDSASAIPKCFQALTVTGSSATIGSEFISCCVKAASGELSSFTIQFACGLRGSPRLPVAIAASQQQWHVTLHLRRGNQDDSLASRATLCCVPGAE